MTLLPHLALSRRLSVKRIVATDVDEYIAKMERRKLIKKRVLSVFRPFHLGHSPKQKEHPEPSSAATHEPSWELVHDCSVSSLGASSSSLAEADNHMEEEKYMEVKEEPTCPVSSSSKDMVKLMLTMSLVYVIARQPTASIPESAALHVLSSDNQETVGKRSPDLLAAMVKTQKQVSPELQAELVDYSRIPASGATNNDPVAEKQVGSSPDHEEEPRTPTAAVLKAAGHPPTDLQSLQEKYANLATITELLSQQLVETALNKKREALSQRKESQRYRHKLCQMEAQHKAQLAKAQSEQKYLQKELRYNVKETIPPCILSNSYSNKSRPYRLLSSLENQDEDRSKQQAGRPHRHSFMEAWTCPVNLCVSATAAAARPKQASYSMASTMILQNRLLPAMLSAVAHAHDVSSGSESHESLKLDG